MVDVAQVVTARMRIFFTLLNGKNEKRGISLFHYHKVFNGKEGESELRRKSYELPILMLPQYEEFNYALIR